MVFAPWGSGSGSCEAVSAFVIKDVGPPAPPSFLLARRRSSFNWEEAAMFTTKAQLVAPWPASSGYMQKVQQLRVTASQKDHPFIHPGPRPTAA